MRLRGKDSGRLGRTPSPRSLCDGARPRPRCTWVCEEPPVPQAAGMHRRGDPAIGMKRGGEGVTRAKGNLSLLLFVLFFSQPPPANPKQRKALDVCVRRMVSSGIQLCVSLLCCGFLFAVVGLSPASPHSPGLYRPPPTTLQADPGPHTRACGRAAGAVTVLALRWPRGLGPHGCPPPRPPGRGGPG